MDDKLVRSLLSSVPILVIASVVLVSLLAWSSSALRLALILIPYRVRKGQIHRLLTAGWLHVDGSHLFFNMLTLYFFAGPVAEMLGTTRFLLLYITSVVVGFIPTTLRYMKKPEYMSLGASGAVAAVMFSAILLVPKLKLYVMFIPIPVPGLIYALGYLAYSVWHSYQAKDNINHDAHFTGAAYGALLTYLFEPARVERTLRQLW
ncbi:rhomboid family intramembrane serine protease [Polyangium aurulentum]|uniref:rhomboid family intramembrane serine protease n=1 Tax=Polyangium aurulentum TaxID=2567896 RepID=UPI0010AE0352|nr:rhomboid family intramembrane serine protease [Polyangium aurulentum]UQA58658.1 rhomboid family intramembrane serine protease [Polyangium aurulentum]